MLFDARKAKELLPGQHLVIDGCPGLRLEVSTTKKTWTYRYKSPSTGKMKQVRFGQWPAMAPLVAGAKWQELKDRRDAGEDLSTTRLFIRLGVKDGADQDYTMGEMVEDYVAGHLNIQRQPRGALLIAERLRKAIKKYELLPVNEINRRFVFDFVELFLKTPVLAASIKDELAAAWNLALDAGRIDQELPNWFRLVNVARKLKSKGALRDGVHKGTTKRVLSATEIKILYGTELEVMFSQQVQDFMTIQQWTCTRGAEIEKMNAKHITEEIDGLWWTIPKEWTKNVNRLNATDLRVPLIGRAQVIVMRLLESHKDNWLFPSKSRTGVITHQTQAYMQSKIHYMQPYSKTKPEHIRKRLSVSHWSPHDLRRTGRTMLAALKCPNDIAEAILGHVKPGVQATYNLYEYDNERREWLGKLDEKLESLIAG